MNQAISNALLFNLMITFVIILIAFFVGSMSYSKASKVNNRIVEEIEKQAEGSDKGRHQEGYSNAAAGGQAVIINNAYANASCDILTWLDKGDDANATGSNGIGYRKGNRACPDPKTLGLAGASDVEPELVSAIIGTAANGSECPYQTNPYEYCVYKVNKCEGTNSCYTYYHVITYMYFDVPIISELIRLPIHGETMGFRIKNS